VSFKCGHCGGRHAKIETVQQCAREALEAKHRGKPVPPHAMVGASFGIIGPKPRGGRELLAARYLVSPNVYVDVRRPRDGKWKDRYFVNVVDDGRATPVADKKARDLLIDTLLTLPWAEMLLAYGTGTGYCPVCNEPLTDGVEREVGLHNVTSLCYQVVERAERENNQKVGVS
jgi:hypothetical protein